MKTKEEILAYIKRFSEENGEDPFEYQASSAPTAPVFMAWCYGKGYLTKESFDSYLVHATDIEFFQLFDEDKENSEAFIITDDYGYDILAEFIASSDFYLDRFNTKFILGDPED